MNLSPQDNDRRSNSPPLQEWQVNRAPRGLGQAGGLTGLPLGRGWGLSANAIAALHDRAAAMRRNPTEPEKRVWRILSGSQLEGAKFRRQAVLPPFIADFLCPSAKLVVEVDGDTHDDAKDRLRDDLLASSGYRTVRVTNLDVMSNIDGVAHEIARALAETSARAESPHPTPSPEGEGLEKGVAQTLLGISLEGSVG